ncbi:MAG TPA: hypothetical protein VL200_00105 [Lacunisphaera sp.]|nr:hypothetical protein [Lacunisphaera sp.]
MSAVTPTCLVAITGGSGAGKTWLTARLARHWGASAACLAQDDFYRDQSHQLPAQRSRVNFDDPAALDWPEFRACLQALRAGRDTDRPAYDFHTHARRPDRPAVEARTVVFVEGLWLCHDPAVRELFHYRVYLRCPAELRLARRLARDVAERGRTSAGVRRQFRQTVEPMHMKYVEPQAEWADVVIDSPCPDAIIAAIHQAVRDRLAAGAKATPAPRRAAVEAFPPILGAIPTFS